VARRVRPARVAAIALNTADLDEHDARAAVGQAQEATGLVADDVVRFGPDRVLDAVLGAFP
jgi:D-glutamate N-acetyltransferase